MYKLQSDDYVNNHEVISRNGYRPAIHPSPQQRLFFNALGFNLVPINNSNNNGGLRLNPTVIITSTVNTTTVTTCVAASEFVDDKPTNCRRRRSGMEHLLAFDDIIGSPTPVEKY